MLRKCSKIYLEINNMKEILIVAVILFLIFQLGKYALEEGVRIEQQKKFEKDLKDWEKRTKK